MLLKNMVDTGSWSEHTLVFFILVCKKVSRKLKINDLARCLLIQIHHKFLGLVLRILASQFRKLFHCQIYFCYDFHSSIQTFQKQLQKSFHLWSGINLVWPTKVRCTSQIWDRPDYWILANYIWIVLSYTRSISCTTTARWFGSLKKDDKK